MNFTTDNNMVWIDLELSGLDPDKDHILEVACLVTNSDLKVVSEEFNIVINQPESILQNMNEWCTNHHQKNGLTEACRSSKLSLKAAENMFLEFLQKYVEKGKSPLAGNSVYMDKIFLMKHMSTVSDYLHYRIVDVSTLKELARRWNPSAYKSGKKAQLEHRALSDIKESINELKSYRRNFLKCTN